ncbi:unnamed protein product, partial [Ascophyllum nodosum]
SGATTEGSCAFSLYYDHANSITRNTQLLYMLLAPIGYLDPIYPRSFHNMIIITFHLNYTEGLYFQQPLFSHTHYCYGVGILKVSEADSRCLKSNKGSPNS